MSRGSRSRSRQRWMTRGAGARLAAELNSPRPELRRSVCPAFYQSRPLMTLYTFFVGESFEVCGGSDRKKDSSPSGSCQLSNFLFGGVFLAAWEQVTIERRGKELIPDAC